MASRSYAFLVLFFLAVTALSFSNAEPEKIDENENDQVLEPTNYFQKKKDFFHKKKEFFHKHDPFHKYPTIKKHPLPPIPVVVIKKHPIPPISIPVIKKKPYVHPHPFPVIKKKPITIPKFTVPKPVYTHPSIPKFTIPKKPCPPIYKKPLFPPHAALP